MDSILRSARLPALFAFAALVTAFAACGDDASSANGSSPTGSDGGGGLPPGLGEGDSGGVDSGSCIAPDMLIALDRTLTMHRLVDAGTPPDTPEGHAASKWALAIAGIKQLVAAPLDQGIRFGLELWPKAAPGCVTLAQRIEGTNGTNPSCQDGEIVVDTELGAGTKIAQALDPETTPICFSTPTGAGLLTAKSYLDAHAAPGKGQLVALVTDGADWDLSCPDPNPLGVVDQLKSSGITTVIVGFSAEASLQNGVGAAFLNDMACAGGAAKDFAQNCVQNANGVYRAKDPDAGPSGTLFYVATNPGELATSLETLAKTVCCGCVK